MSKIMINHREASLDISGPRLILILGGSTVALDWAGRKISGSAPVPTSHVHIYDFDEQAWLSTSLLGQESNLTRNQSAALSLVKIIETLCSDWLRLGPRIMVLLRQLSYAIKIQLKAPKVPY